MFQHSQRLPHLLAPSCYYSSEYYAREVEQVLRTAWHLVATTADLPRSGDYLTFDLLGTPIQLRNFAGTLAAISNVCAHRHCFIASSACGHSERMRCQYHGWEYDADGRTRKIPQPKNFTPFDRDETRLATYRVATCGALVFVSLAAEGISLREQLGEMYDRIAERFGAGWECFLRWQPNYPANWKVPLENSLEAYHVPYVHPHTFREDPGAERSTHGLEAQHTWFATQLPFSPHSQLDTTFQRCEGWLMRRLGEEPHGRYEQHHIFPNLLISFTDVVSLCQSILPTSATSCRAVVRQFGKVGVRSNLLWRTVARGFGRLEAIISRGILQEDLALFAEIQRGLQASQQPGVLGACEERIWKFQQYLYERCHASNESIQPANEHSVNEMSSRAIQPEVAQ
jgi:phenylpropionate dioxygenase-like ring-hydroxylating dioxygenase large terminal subunit